MLSKADKAKALTVMFRRGNGRSSSQSSLPSKAQLPSGPPKPTGGFCSVGELEISIVKELELRECLALSALWLLPIVAITFSLLLLGIGRLKSIMWDVPFRPHRWVQRPPSSWALQFFCKNFVDNLCIIFLLLDCNDSNPHWRAFASGTFAYNEGSNFAVANDCWFRARPFFFFRRRFAVLLFATAF